MAHSVVLPSGDDAADVATWIDDDAQISENQMNMAMKHGLASAFTNVESVWMELLLFDVTALHPKFSNLCMFFRFKVEETTSNLAKQLEKGIGDYIETEVL